MKCEGCEGRFDELIPDSEGMELCKDCYIATLEDALRKCQKEEKDQFDVCNFDKMGFCYCRKCVPALHETFVRILREARSDKQAPEAIAAEPSPSPSAPSSPTTH